MTYRPLPDGIKVGESKIEGQGLITTKYIDADEHLGMFHYYTLEGEIIRTPLAGFTNHSETPNCVKVHRGIRSYLVTIRSIHPGEELTIKYDLYKPGK